MQRGLESWVCSAWRRESNTDFVAAFQCVRWVIRMIQTFLPHSERRRGVSFKLKKIRLRL